MNYIISNQENKTNKIKDKEIIIKVGDHCRIRNKKVLFDKLQNNYSNKIYEIIKVNKNTVKSDNEEIVKKSDVLIIDVHKSKGFNPTSKERSKTLSDNKNRLLSSDELDSNHEKINAEKDHKIFSKLKKLNMNTDNIIEGKRERKLKEFF